MASDKAPPDSPVTLSISHAHELARLNPVVASALTAKNISSITSEAARGVSEKYEHFGRAMLELINTPGGSSDDPKFNQPTPLINDTSMNPQQLKREARRKFYAEIVDKLRVAAYSETTVRLTGPEKLTVASKGSGYFMESHVGGEEFKIYDVKVTAESKQVIVCLTPTIPSSYRFAEVPLKKAMSSFLGFTDLLLSVFPDYHDREMEIELIGTQEKEAREFEKKAETYEGFGSW